MCFIISLHSRDFFPVAKESVGVIGLLQGAIRHLYTGSCRNVHFKLFFEWVGNLFHQETLPDDLTPSGFHAWFVKVVLGQQQQAVCGLGAYSYFDKMAWLDKKLLLQQFSESPTGQSPMEEWSLASYYFFLIIILRDAYF